MVVLHLHHHLVLVNHLNGKETITVMMRTTMQDVNGTVVIAVATMSRRISAQLVNVWTLLSKEV